MTMTDTPEEWSDSRRHLRPDALAAGVLLALSLLMTWNRWVFDNWLARHDLLTFFLPWFGALGDRLRDLDVPALNPYIFSGAPFAGDPESGWMYLPAMVIFPFFEVTVAYKLMILALLLIAGMSTYVLARVVGYGVLAALFSAVAFEFGPFFFGQTDCCTVGTMTMTFFPLAFLGIELALRAASWPVRVAAWVIAGFAISQMFAAWLGQGVVNGLILVAAWVFFRAVITPPASGWDLRRRLVSLVTTGPAVLGIGLLLGAAGILPRLAANAESNNAGGTYENTPGSHNFHFHTLASALKTIMVDAHGYRGTSVWGTVFVLMLLSVFILRRRSVLPFFVVAAVIIPALAMGVRGIADLFYLIPFYENMQVHSPGRIFWLYSFIPAMLAGGAVNELPRLASMRLRWLIAMVPLGVSALAAWYVKREEGIGVGHWFWIGAIGATVLVAVVAFRLPGRIDRQRISQGAVLGLVALVFLLPNSLDIVESLTMDTPPPGRLEMRGNDPWMQDIIHETLRTDDPGGAGEFLQQRQETEPPFRFIAYGGMYHPDSPHRTYPSRRLEPAMVAILQNARAMRLRLETTQGYDPLQPLVYQEFIHALNGRQQDYHYANLLHVGVNSPLLDLLNVRYIVVPRTIPEDRDDIRALTANRVEVYRDDEVVIYESPTVQPRGWMVYDVRTDGDGLAQLASGDVDGAEVAFVRDVPSTVAPPVDGEESSVRMSTWTPDALIFQVNHTGEGMLIVSQVYSENWTATVDGQSVDVLQADHALLGIPVGPGEHTVEVRYAPATLKIGLWVSGVSGVLAIAVLGYGGWVAIKERRSLPAVA